MSYEPGLSVLPVLHWWLHWLRDLHLTVRYGRSDGWPAAWFCWRAMLQPLLRLNTTALTQALTEYKLDLSAYSTDLEEENQELMKGIIEEQAGAYILDKATALGITCQVRVEAQEEEEWPIPHSVFISGVLTQEQQQALTQVIEREFAIPAARQYYESGADEA